jgi:hypothetical protein
MPFDRFTIEQIAGDMLPSATNDQIIATGFHRNTMFNEEGGVDKEEAHWLELVDRVNTTGTVWLGSTIGCAQCHNHKFDPFTQKEYFQLLAFFNNGEMETKKYGDTSQKFIEPVLDLATPEQAARRDQIEHEIEEIEERAKTPTPALEREQRQWEKEVLVAARDWKVVVPTSTRATATLTVAPDGSVLASGENPARDVYEIEARSPLRKITAIRLEALPHQSLPKGGPGRDMYGNFFLKDLEVDAGSGKLCFTDAIADNGRLHDRDRDQLWIADASREDQRLPRQLVLLFDRPVEARNLRIRMHHETNVGHQGLGRFRLSVTAAKDPERIVKISHKLRPVLESSQRAEEQVKQLQEYFLTVAPSLQPDRDRLKALRQELEDLQIPTTLVLRESPSFERPSAVIRVRGNFLEKGDLVYAGVPAALHRLPATEMPNRLGLARWLVSRDNPLTSRVAVNRFWEQILGRGIVETAEDFGTQGEKPTHPELLDWLAVEFMDRGWSMKAIHRLIVTSATYRQSSKLTPTLQQRDPLNKLLARAPRFRVEAEMVRDIVLAASGLLSRTIGGPSVFPPQPEGIWDLPYNDDKWVPSEGEDRYRRGLYTFMRRTAPYPSFLTFDAGSREICTVRRPRTNTPLQALTTLNDPAFFEAAEALGRLISKEGVEQAFRRCTSRRPTAAELERIRAAGLSEALVANVLLNLDEALTKE